MKSKEYQCVLHGFGPGETRISKLNIRIKGKLRKIYVCDICLFLLGRSRDQYRRSIRPYPYMVQWRLERTNKRALKLGMPELTEPDFGSVKLDELPVKAIIYYYARVRRRIGEGYLQANI